jgi:hypothetical protein
MICERTFSRAAPAPRDAARCAVGSNFLSVGAEPSTRSRVRVPSRRRGISPNAPGLVSAHFLSCAKHRRCTPPNSHSSAKIVVPNPSFSIHCKAVYILLKIRHINPFVFTLMRTLSREVPCYEQTNKNIPGVWVPLRILSTCWRPQSASRGQPRRRREHSPTSARSCGAACLGALPACPAKAHSQRAMETKRRTLAPYCRAMC